MSSGQRQLEAIILAAGKGTRMNSDLPKVLHPVADRPMVDWVVDACEAVGCSRIVVVIGHQGDKVREALADRDNCVFVEQTQQLGTGHAVMMAEPLYKNPQAKDILVLCGDGPLIRTTTLDQMLAAHRDGKAAATLATSILPDATGYGRIVRNAAGQFERIVEQKDATPDQRQSIREVNPSYYCFDAAALFDSLHKIDNKNANGEYYITDVFEVLLRGGKRVAVIDAVPPQDVLSINTPQQLAEVDQVLRQRLGAEVQQ